MLRKMGSFRSYVGLEEYEMKPTSKKPDDSLQPTFLSGELVISEALNVLKFTSSSKKKGMSGSLFVTNARVIFVTSEKTTSTKTDAMSLLAINTLWYYENPKGSDGGKKHRRAVKLGPSSVNNPNLIPSGSTRVHELLLVCSNFRTSRFSFKFSPLDHGLRTCNAIIHHAFPVQLERLFYFDFSKVTSADWRQTVCNSTVSVPTYLEKGDWLKELNITRSTSGYRISNINEGFQLCGSLPEWIVVPADLNDVRVTSLAEKLKGSRPPHWSWGDAKGAAILKMSKLNNEADSSAENVFFELLRKTHVKKIGPEIIDVDKALPSKEVRTAFNKLVELSCPESNHQYEENDSRFYSLLDQTKWFSWISKTLEIVDLASKRIAIDQAVIIFQENESRDLSCLCSSVLQVVVDPRFRTVTGFFSLIQKEWIAFGHPFHSCYMHASPVLLMFLDTVHQLMKQNPVEFEFNDQLLCQVWDSTFDSTRGTFLFDTPQQRKAMDRWNEFTAWTTILTNEEEINPPVSRLSVPGAVQAKLASPPRGFQLPRNLMNPMFTLKALLFPPKVDNSPHSATLQCSSCMCDLELWENLYLKRTSDTTPKIGMQFGNKVSKPFFATERHSSSSTPTPSKSPETTESTFVYPPPQRRLESTSSIQPPLESLNNPKPGRDTTHELNVVENLMTSLSSTTRYNRNSNLGNRQTQNNSGVSVSHSSSPSAAPKVPARFRKNPFS